ncbi:MAG: hypothetical protein GXO11_03975 [Epsilonproteobacteria bacterium]|nr:hypothetical protein [Campylobacterota bacterium]
MSITGLIIIGIIATLILHFIGIFTKSLKLVWIVIIFLWAFGIDVFVSEIKPKGYEEVKKMQGKYKDTDELIQQSGKKISFYELLEIKQSYLKHEREEE